MRKTYSGYMHGNYYRSYAEWLFATYNILLNGYEVKTEPFRLSKNNTSNIPDFLINNGSEKFLVELKTSQDQIENLIVDYVHKQYDIGYDIKFVNFDKKVQKRYKSRLKDFLGNDEFLNIEKQFKNNTVIKKMGFPGKLNPMWGKKHGKDFVEKLHANRRSYTGKNNPNYGKTHSYESRIKIGLKWKDETKKRNMKIKGLLTHYKNFDDNQRKDFLEYVKSFKDHESKKLPSFVNVAYKLSNEKIEDLFESIDNLLNKLGEIK